MGANVADLGEVLLRRVVMRDVSTRDHSGELFGQRMALPVILAPVGLGGMFARRAEVQAARAAEAAGIPFVESTLSRCSIEEVARAASTPPWFQLYVMRDRGFTEELIARARAVGSPVLVLTVDLAVVGARHRDTRNAVVGQPRHWANIRRGLDLLSHPRWIRDVGIGGRPLTFGNLERAVPDAGTPGGVREWVDGRCDLSVTWNDIAWVREYWDGMLVVMGVLDPREGRRALRGEGSRAGSGVANRRRRASRRSRRGARGRSAARRRQAARPRRERRRRTRARAAASRIPRPSLTA